MISGWILFKKKAVDSERMFRMFVQVYKFWNFVGIPVFHADTEYILRMDIKIRSSCQYMVNASFFDGEYAAWINLSFVDFITEPVRSQSFEEKRSRSLEDKHPETKERNGLYYLPL